jgi:hypothetical protein
VSGRPEKSKVKPEKRTRSAENHASSGENGFVDHQGTKSTKERQVEGLELSATRRGPSLRVVDLCFVVWPGEG